MGFWGNPPAARITCDFKSLYSVTVCLLQLKVFSAPLTAIAVRRRNTGKVLEGLEYLGERPRYARGRTNFLLRK
jgi:hypothetical protein